MQDILSHTATFVLAGGRGKRLTPLTRSRSKPAVPFGDRRIIDFVLANCVQSNVPHPVVLAQYQAAHLNEHVGRWWLRQSASGADATASPVCVPAPKSAYLGTADALLRGLHVLSRHTRHILVLSADHIYEMDYRDLLQFHVECGADATLGSIVYPRESSRQFGILQVDGQNRVRGFEEKPSHPKEIPGRPGSVLANMGVYVFRTETLVKALRRDAEDAGSAHDIGRSILPGLVTCEKTYAFRFEDPETGKPRYWRDVGTIDSYYEASMEWLDALPGAHRLAGSQSVIGTGVRIHRSAEVLESILMPGVIVGPRARVRRAILDENVRVMKGAEIGFGPGERHPFQRTANGVWVVPANATVAPAGGRNPDAGRLMTLQSQKLATSS